jgi:hypothetical protein
MFFLQLSQFKQWLMRGPTDAEQTRICRTLAGMHWSVRVSHENGRPVAVRWLDCGFEQASMCLLPTTNFAYTRPEDHRDPVPADERFLRSCGVRPPDVRDDLKCLDR